MATIAAPECEKDRLQTKCIQALKEEHKVQLQREDLRSQLKKLRRHGKALDESSGLKKADTTDAFLAFAKTVCLEFCNKVHKTFPREIRDIIYGFVNESDRIIIAEKPKKKKEYQRPIVTYFDTSSEAQIRLGSITVKTDHWWKKDFVGGDMVREIGESYFRSTCFDFQSQFDTISKFRVTDQWKLGFLPVSFVSIVDVTIKCTYYDFDDFDGYVTASESEHEYANYSGDGWGGVWGDTDRPTRKSRASLLVKLESLFGFKSGCSLTIQLRTTHRVSGGWSKGQEWLCNSVVPVIFSTVQRLKYAGYRVQIRLCAGHGYYPGTVSFTSSCNPESYGAFRTEYEMHAKEEKKRIEDLLELEDESIWGGEE